MSELLLEVFPKNQKANLSKAQRNPLAKLVTELKDSHTPCAEVDAGVD